MVEIAKITKIDEVTDAFEITTYNLENPDLIKYVDNYVAIKEKKKGSNNDVITSNINTSTLREYRKSSKVYQHGKSVQYHDNGKVMHEELYQ